MGRKSISDIRKPEILEHVYQVLKIEGLQGTTLSKIASHMGVNTSLLLHYFKTKDDIMVALTESIIKKYLSYLDGRGAQFEKIEDRGSRREAMLDMLFDPDWDQTVDAGVFYSCFYLSFKNKKIQRLINEMYIGFKNQVAQLLREHDLHDVLLKDECDKAAVAIIALLEGYAYYRAATGDDTINGSQLTYLKKVANCMLTTNS